jgi:hypothetical protein
MPDPLTSGRLADNCQTQGPYPRLLTQTINPKSARFLTFQSSTESGDDVWMLRPEIVGLSEIYRQIIELTARPSGNGPDIPGLGEPSRAKLGDEFPATITDNRGIRFQDRRTPWWHGLPL